MSSHHLTLNLLEGSVSFNFSSTAAQELKAEINLLIESLKTVTNHQGLGKAKSVPQNVMDYQHIGEVFLEIFCNPNIWPTPFAAKVLITIHDKNIRLTTEAELTRILEDINQYLEMCI